MSYEHLSEEQLYIMWKNCRDNLNNPTRTEKARERIAKIEQEWDQRIADAETGNYPTTAPSIGMMRRLGYHVGVGQGLTLQARRNIIDLVMTERLPFFHSPMYVNQWGEPNSRTRYLKLIRFFNGMLGARHAGDMDQAQDEWSKDLEYVKTTYGFECE